MTHDKLLAKCKHIYEYVHANPCPFCGGESHEPDWNLLKEQRKLHIEKYGLFNTIKEWWSI